MCLGMVSVVLGEKNNGVKRKGKNMGRPSQVIEVVFSEKEVMWLWRQADSEKLTLSGMIRRRALNHDSDIWKRESYSRVGEGKPTVPPLFDEFKGKEKK